MVPHHSSGTGVHREGIILRGHQHHSIDHQRSDLEPLGIARMKDPLRAQTREIARIDLGKTTVPPAGIVAVVRNPIRCGWLMQQILGTNIDRRRCNRGRVISRPSRKAGECDRRDPYDDEKCVPDATCPVVAQTLTSRRTPAALFKEASQVLPPHHRYSAKTFDSRRFDTPAPVRSAVPPSESTVRAVAIE